MFEVVSNASDLEPSDNAWSINYLALYFILVLLLVSRTLFRWACLQFKSINPTDEPDVFTTSLNLPPLTLSWPRRAVVVPDGMQGQTALIQHERAHLQHHDAEMTICLLMVRDLMLCNYGISYLVRQWRLAIELRADRAVTEMLSTSERKDYAALLLNGLRSGGDHTDRRTLPCPTAHLTSTRHRSVKMRLSEIMENKPTPRKNRWNTVLLLTTLGAGMLGLISINAKASDSEFTIQADKIIYDKRVPPNMPASCPGLNADEIKIEWAEHLVEGKLVPQHSAILGTVVLKYDVRPDGNTHNLRVIKSTNACFEPEAVASVSQWMVQPQGDNLRDVAVILKFVLVGETHEDINPLLNDFLQ